MELCKQPIISPITAIITPGPAISPYYRGIGSDHPGHTLSVVPDITSHMVTTLMYVAREYQAKAIWRRRADIMLIKLKQNVRKLLKVIKSHYNEMLNLFNS